VKSKKLFILLPMVCVGAIFATGMSQSWQQFSSSTGFSVAYPSNWFRTGVSPDRLAILSSKGGAEGVIIKDRQAEITVIEAPKSEKTTLEQVIADDMKGSSILSRRFLTIEHPVERGCSNLIEITSKEQVIPAEYAAVKVPYIVNTGFYCEVKGHKYITLLRNTLGDVRQEKYRSTALHIVESLRVVVEFPVTH
jgi:hypothetical protein